MAGETSESSTCHWVFPRIWSFGLLLLVGATWPLWFPGLTPQMPLIPLVRLLPFGSFIALSTGHLASALLLLCLALVTWAPNRFRRLWWVIAGCLAVSFCLDQHRLQPWAYQSFLYAIVFASMDPTTARRWLIPLAASVYGYSAAGKFDFQFAHSVGQDFLKAATDMWGGLPAELSEGQRVRLALLFPACELIAAVGLLVPKTRRIAAGLLMVMHVGLIAILGPWNRDHSLGVLVWNLLLLAQAYLLLMPTPRASRAVDSAASGDRQDSRSTRLTGVAARMLVVTALAAPLLERRGYWDHWTSWSLYSPHTSHVDIEIHQSAIDRLSDSHQTHLRDDTDQDSWYLLDAGAWSLSARRVPVYPQARYQLALAADIAREYELSDDIRARLSGVSDRLTGRRTHQLMRNRREIDEALRRFWLRPSMD